MHTVVMASLVVVLAAGDALAQTGGRGASASAAKAPRTTQVRLAVKDSQGAPIDDVNVTLSGDDTGKFTTGGAGTAILPNLKDGNYRVRVERKGYVTLEREFTLRTGAPSSLDVTLTAAPPPPPPPPAPKPAPPKALPPSGPPVNLSIIDFFEKNFISGRDPQKESVVACTPLETVRLLQLREPVASHSHADVDEIVYVVAGEGSAKLGGEDVTLKPGVMLLVPRASAHAFERRGKNPLMLISTLAGAPCQEAVESR